MRYAHPGTEGAKISFKSRYGNYIGGEFVPPVKGEYFTNTSPVNGQPIAEFPRSTAEDIDKALDAAHAAADAWGRTSVQDRSNVLLKIADRIEQNLEILAITETWDNGKPIRETLNADIPLAVDHFRYFAGCIRAQEGGAAEINENTVAYHIHEPLGVVGRRAGENCGVLLRGTKRDEVERGQVLVKPGSVKPHTKFTAEVYVLSKEEGGRHTPFFKGYRPQFYFRTTDVTGNCELPEGVEMVMPGDNIQMTVTLIKTIAMEDGLRFAIREGGRTVGAGVVAKIIE